MLMSARDFGDWRLYWGISDMRALVLDRFNRDEVDGARSRHRSDIG